MQTPKDKPEPDFTLSDYFNPEDAEYVKKYLPDTLYVHPFKNLQGKYFSVVSQFEDGQPREVEAVFSIRYKLRLTFIKEKNDINEVLITRYKYKKRKNDWDVDSTQGLRLEWMSFKKILGFLKFLSELHLLSIDERRIKLVKDSLVIDDEERRKLKTLFATPEGKRIFNELFEQGYLTSDLDIPDLIKKGLTHSKVQDKFAKIDEFEQLISKADVKEVSEIQRRLSEIPWIFGPEYVSLDVRTAGEVGIPDRRLKRIDGLSDILEVKLPKAELLRTDEVGRHYIAPDLAQALGQLTGYLEHYYSEYRTEYEDATRVEKLEDAYGRYYKPKGILLIGRRKKVDGTSATARTSDAEPKHLRRLMSYYHWVEVLTYDDLIERARNGLRKLIEVEGSE